MSSCSSSGWRGGSKSLYSWSFKSLPGEADFFRVMTIAADDDVEGGVLSSSPLVVGSVACRVLLAALGVNSEYPVTFVPLHTIRRYVLRNWLPRNLLMLNHAPSTDTTR